MPRVKREEKEEELDIKKEVKKETFTTRWFRDYAVDNPTELKMVCDLTAKSAHEQFILTADNTEVYGVIFYATFITILEFLKEKEKKWNNFTIEIARSINIGFINDTSEDNEKVGNFMPILEYIGINPNIVPDSRIYDEEGRVRENATVQNYISWKELNSKKNADEIKTIQSVAYDKLVNNYKVQLRTPEAVIPLFCIFMDTISSVLKLKFHEAQGTSVSEVSMNVFGLFTIYYSYDEEDNQEIIEFKPNILMKRALKSDDNSDTAR